jgi:hypothetical protein
MEDFVGAAELEAVEAFLPLDLAVALSGCASSVIEALARIGVVSTKKRAAQSLFSLRDALRVARDTEARAARKRELATAARLRARRRVRPTVSTHREG